MVTRFKKYSLISSKSLLIAREFEGKAHKHTKAKSILGFILSMDIE